MMFRNNTSRSEQFDPTTGGSLSGAATPVLPAPSRAELLSRLSSAAADRAKKASEESGNVSRRIPIWKRCLDLTLIFLTLPVWAPMIGLIALWIKLTSRGPVFFRQKRIGQGGQPFTLLKLRSMEAGADTSTHLKHVEDLLKTNKRMLKLDTVGNGDDRTLRGMRLLRALGADELPQVFNVIAGHMSLVGPRPCLPEEFENYSPSQRARLNAPPGLTGYWQVSGKNRTTFSEMVEMDLNYAKNMSLLFDFVILIGTIPSILLQVTESKLCPLSPQSGPSLPGSGLSD